MNFYQTVRHHITVDGSHQTDCRKCLFYKPTVFMIHSRIKIHVTMTMKLTVWIWLTNNEEHLQNQCSLYWKWSYKSDKMVQNKTSNLYDAHVIVHQSLDQSNFIWVSRYLCNRWLFLTINLCDNVGRPSKKTVLQNCYITFHMLDSKETLSFFWSTFRSTEPYLWSSFVKRIDKTVTPMCIRGWKFTIIKG